MKLSCIPILLLTLSTAAVAGESAAAERFAPVADLAGSCWRGEFPNGAVDTHCFDWALQGAYLRDRHEVKGGKGIYEGETFYGWDESNEVLRYWYFNSIGGISTGSVRKTGGVWVFDEHYEGGKQQIEMRTRMERPDPDSYRFITETLEDGKWVKPQITKYVRVK